MWLPLLLLLAACGPDEEERAAARRREAREAAVAERTRRAEALAERAIVHAGREELDEAWKLWREATGIVGETPGLAEAADRIRTVERRMEERRRYEELLDLLDRDTEAASEEERLAILARTAEAARAWLEEHGDHEGAEEVRAGLKHAEYELGREDRFASAVEEAADLLAAGLAKEAAAKARAALEIRRGGRAEELLSKALRALTPTGMVHVPEGTFLSGKEGESRYLPAFYIDRTEVTNAQYAAFVKATGHPAPSHFAGGSPPAGKGDHPVVNVALPDALAYAKWAGKRLPTEHEWERAARGTDGRAYPWGDEWEEGKGHFGRSGTVPVGSMPFDRSPDGVMDLGGNVMEMTLAADDPLGERAGPVMKGGHWSSDFYPKYALAHARWPVDRARKGPDSGFRCAKSAP